MEHVQVSLNHFKVPQVFFYSLNKGVLTCANNLCNNGGICSAVTPGQYSLTGFICSCSNGFSGSLCENCNFEKNFSVI